MSQANETTIAHPIPLDRQRRYAAAGAIAALIAAVTLAGAFVISALSSGPVTVPSPRNEQLVDGWVPAAAAAGTAHLERVQDGYLTGLIGARSDGDLVDGYLPGLVTAQSADTLVDGWMATIPGRSAGVQDGWESSPHALTGARHTSHERRSRDRRSTARVAVVGAKSAGQRCRRCDRARPAAPQASA